MCHFVLFSWMLAETNEEDDNFMLVSLLLYMNVINCDKTPFYHEPSKEVFYAGDMPDDALFGYSITYQSMRKKIIVGAPRADFQGKVFECDRSENQCREVNIPQFETGINNTYYWLGAAVSAGSDFFVTCAPRYCQEGIPDTNIKGGPYVASKCFYQSAASGSVNNITGLTIGYKTNTFEEFWEKSTREGLFDTLGWSMDVSSDDITIVGGPGGVMGRASLIPKRKLKKQMPLNVYRNSTDLVLYELGYSVKAGKFLGSEVYAVSSPYGVMGQGKVLFFSKNRELMQAVVDNEVGTMFGGALCNVRLDKNGEEALFVGAPASAVRRGDVDVGVVHVYVNEAGNMRWKRTIPGYKNNGYFGYAIVSVGDLNLDDQDEVVISAPYENEYRGAVYIFSGADLMNTSSDIQWLQRIEGDAPGQMLGLSLAALPDLDGNGCNELSIGVAGNNSAILMNCITHFTFTLGFGDVSPSIVDHKDYRSLHKKACVNIPGNKKLKQTIENALFVSIIGMARYGYVPVFSTEKKYGLAVTIKLIHPNATLVDLRDNILSYNVSLADLNITHCRKLEIKLPDNGNYDEIMVLEMHATLSGEDTRNMTTFKSGLVLLTNDTKTYLVDPMELAVLGSNLSMDLSTTFKGNSTKGYNYMIGSTQHETLTLEVHNAASSRSGAYRACVRVSIEGVGVARASRNCAVAGDEVTCELKDGPILAGQSMVVNITLDTKTLTGEAESIAIKSKLHRNCSDDQNNFIFGRDALISLQRDNDIIIIGELTPSAPVNVSREEIAFGYENIKHVYSVRNSGVTSWEKVSCDVRIPEYVSFTIADLREGLCVRLQNKNEATCEFKLASNGEKDIIVLMNVLPHTSFTEEVLRGKATKLETEVSCKVKYGDKVISRITTTMKLLQNSVPLYILVIAAIVGLLLLLLLAYILYECGFLRRKHKEELLALKKDVRRQSIRRSMRLHESMVVENDDLGKPTNQDGDTDSVVTTDVTDRLHDRTSKAVIHYPAAEVN